MNIEHNDSPHQGFTMIEILVVLAIVGVLSALLLPSFSAVRERGRSATCLNNLRQIGIATRLYTEDYDGNYPYAMNPLTHEEGENSFIPDQVFDEVPVYPDVLRPYTKTDQVFQCPSDTGLDTSSDIGVVDNAFATWNTSYNYNYLIPFFLSRSDVEWLSPSHLDLYQDMGFWHGSASSLQWDQESKFVNVVYADLHAKRVLQKDASPWGFDLEARNLP